MIKAGSTVVLDTQDAVYTTCKVLELSAKNITVSYFAGLKYDSKNNQTYEDHRTDIVDKRKIISISERL